MVSKNTHTPWRGWTGVMQLTGSHCACPGASRPWDSMGQPQHCPERLLCQPSACWAILHCRQSDRDLHNDHQLCEKGLRDLSRLWWQPLHTQQEARRSQSQVIHSGVWWENKGQQPESEIWKVQVRSNGKPFCHEARQAVEGAAQRGVQNPYSQAFLT